MNCFVLFFVSCFLERFLTMSSKMQQTDDTAKDDLIAQDNMFSPSYFIGKDGELHCMISMPGKNMKDLYIYPAAIIAKNRELFNEQVRKGAKGLKDPNILEAAKRERITRLAKAKAKASGKGGLSDSTLQAQLAAFIDD